MNILDSKKKILTLLLFLSPMLMTGDATRIKYVPDTDSFVIVKGTSSLHDWSVRTNQIEGFAEFKELVTGLSLEKVLSLSLDFEKPVVHISISATSLKSEKKGMDQNMYKALKSRQYPFITYDLSALKVAKMKDPSHILVTTTGSLNITGISRPLEMSVMVSTDTQNEIVFTGNTRLKMTDFQIKPPKAMMGMIKTGDEVEVQFKWTIHPSS